MLQTLVSVANFIKTAFYYILFSSYKAGYLLVSSLKLLFQCLWRVTASLHTLCLLLCDSVMIFLQDNLQYVKAAFLLITSAIDLLCHSFVALVSKVAGLLQATANLILSVGTALVQLLSCICIAVYEAAFFLRKCVILFGSGMWFLITLLPITLYYLYISISSLCQEICSLIYVVTTNVLTFINIKSLIRFLFDIPLESLAGLAIALSLGYVFAQFYIVITSYCKRKWRACRNWYQRTHQRQGRRVAIEATNPTRVIERRGRRPVGAPSTVAVKPKGSPEMDKCCVICQERLKCVLLLPCRHACLCVECSRELRLYNEMCPICRSDIENTMKIYV